MQLLAYSIINIIDFVRSNPESAGMIGFGFLAGGLLVNWYFRQQKLYNNPKR